MQLGKTMAASATEEEERVCMKKVVAEETVQYDEEERCHHVDRENCYQVFRTVYKKAVVRRTVLNRGRGYLVAINERFTLTISQKNVND